jgi:hypothetical protein
MPIAVLSFNAGLSIANAGNSTWLSSIAMSVDIGNSY